MATFDCLIKDIAVTSVSIALAYSPETQKVQLVSTMNKIRVNGSKKKIIILEIEITQDNAENLPAAASETARAIAELETVRLRPIISSNSASLMGGGPSGL